MTTTEAASLLGIDPSNVWRLIRSGHLKAERVGPIYRIDAEDVKRLKAERKRNPPRPGPKPKKRGGG